MHLHATRKIRRRTPVYDHAGELIGYADRDKALELLKNPFVVAGGTTKVIKSFTFAVDVADTTSGARSRGTVPLGTPRKEGRSFSFDFIRTHWRIEFERVMRECGAVDRVLPIVRKWPVYIEQSNVPVIPLTARKPAAVVIPFPVRTDVQEFRQAA